VNTVDLKWAALWIAMAMYVIAAALMLRAALRGRSGTSSITVVGLGSGFRVPGTMLCIAIAAHLTGLLLRGAAAGRLPVQNLFESLVTASLIAAVGGLVIARFAREPVAALAGAIAGAAGLAAGALLPIPGRAIEPEAAILATAPLLAWHVGAVLGGYAFIALGAAASLATLLAAKGRSPERLARLDRVQVLLAQLSFLALGVGVLLGAWWAHSAWGRWWGWDPKETWALITWMVYLVGVHIRIRPSAAGPQATAWFNIAGFVLMLWSYFGVNLLFPGLHSYAG
jgi:ABC-type transport system involved in cytochrome c biogenesis permease subunit